MLSIIRGLSVKIPDYIRLVRSGTSCYFIISRPLYTRTKESFFSFGKSWKGSVQFSQDKKIHVKIFGIKIALLRL